MKKTVAVAVACLSLGSLAAAAEVGAVNRQYELNIPKLPLTDALQELARQTGLQIAHFSDAIDGSAIVGPVSGMHSVEEALQRLLAPSGLVFKRVSDRTIAVVQPTSATSARLTNSAGAFRLAQADSSSSRGGDDGRNSDGNPAGPPSPNGQDRGRRGNADASAQTVGGGVEEITVTGTRIGLINEGVIPRRENEALRYEIIDREQLSRSGATSLPEFFRQVSGVTNFGTGTQQVYGSQLGAVDGVGSTSDPVNLRGLGSHQTLVLINGRRLYGSETVGPDLSRIPMSAVERIEILHTSGSAIYGANAIGGVINIVLKKNVHGTEVDLYVGAAEGGAEEVRSTIFQGASFNDGRTNLSMVAELKKTEPLRLGERKYYRPVFEKFPRGHAEYNRMIGQPFAGPRANVVYVFGPEEGLGIPGSPTDTIAYVPEGSDGMLTPEDFVGVSGRASEDTSRLDGAVLIPGGESYSFFGALEHEFSRDLGAYAEVSVRYADNSTSAYEGIIGAMTMTPDNPFNPFRNDVTPGFAGRTVNVFVDPRDLPDDSVKSIQRTLRVVGGLQGRFSALGGREFNWLADFSWDRNENYASTVRYTQYLRAAVLAGLYNPLRDMTNVPLADEETLAAARSRTKVIGHPEISAANLRLNGDLFEAWGGTARFSLGAEFRIEQQYFSQVTENGAWSTLPGAATGFADGVTETDRRAAAGYLEITVPLVGRDNARPLLHELSVSGAMRLEKYEDFRSTSPLALAVKYAPIRDLALRASFSEGFQPPTLQSLHNVGTILTDVLTDVYVDPLRPGLPNEPVTIRSAFGNPNLKPEVSESWDAGLILTPRWVPGLTLNVSYFRYDKRDVIASLSLQNIIDYFPDHYTRGPNLPTDPPGVPGPITEFDATFFNIANLLTDGWDYNLTYTRPVGKLGVLTLDASVTRTKRFRRRASPDAPEIENVGILGNGESFPLEWRGRLGVGWQRNAWSASWLARYTGKYVYSTNDPSPSNPWGSGYDGPYIPSTLEHDFKLSYQLPDMGTGAAEWLSGTQLSLGVLNVFDREPPYVTNQTALYYSFFNDPRQRFVYFEARKAF